MKVTLGGFPVLGSSSALWRFASGTDPVVEGFDVAPDAAASLLAGRGTPIELKYESIPITFKNLWVLRESPAPNPRLRRVLVADRRWLWPYIHILRRYNMRRRVGFFRITDPTVAELQRVEEDVWYARYSMRDPDAGEQGKWRSDEMLGDVFGAVLEAEKELSGAAPELNIKRRDIDFARSIPIENLEIDDPAPAAIQRAIGYFPEFSFYLDAAGDVVLYSRASGLEEALLKLAGPEFVGEGHVEFVDRSLERPQAIDVLFTYEAELRFDALEVEDSATAEDTNQTEARLLDNVLPIPDFSIEVPVGSGQILPQSTYVTFDEYMPAAGDMPGIGVPIDHKFLQQGGVAFNDLWGALLLTGERDADRDWSARVSAFQRHYRQTYRLNRRWMDRILSLRAYRISTVNREAGSRAPAEAYSDHAVLGSQRSFFRDAAVDNGILYAINVFGYPSGDGDPPFDFEPNQRPSPAIVSIVDHDQGVLRVEYKSDPVRLYEVFMPSPIENMPNGDLDRDLTEKLQSGLPGNPLEIQPVAFDSIPESLRGQVDVLPKLTSKHRIAMVLTAIPASPNNVRQLHRVRVTPEDVFDLLPLGMQRGLNNARGPVKEIRVRAGVETARVAWRDANALDIEELFGVEHDDPEDNEDSPEEAAIPLQERIRDLVINETEEAQGAASLNTIARATAAREYARFADHFEGDAAYDMNPQVEPGGWIDEVTLEQTPAGVALMRLSLPEQLPKLDWLSLADAGSRAIVMRLAQKSQGQ